MAYTGTVEDGLQNKATLETMAIFRYDEMVKTMLTALFTLVTVDTFAMEKVINGEGYGQPVGIGRSQEMANVVG